MSGFWCGFRHPPSAQAHMPSRPSGADKEKERAQNEGGRAADRGGRLALDRANIVARRHGFQITLLFRSLRSRNKVKPALTVDRTRSF